MRIVRRGRTEVVEMGPGRWSATGPLAEVSQVLAEARQYGPIRSTLPQAAGDGLVLVNFQQSPAQAPQQAVPARPARQPAPPAPWARRHWRPLAAVAGVVLALAGFGTWWLVAHLDELLALAVKGALTLAGVGFIAALVRAALSGGGGGSHCPGPFHK